MTSLRMTIVLLLCVAAGFCPTAFAADPAAPSAWRSLFNGKDLSGWDGNPQLWSVKDGVIVGQTTDPKQLTYNQFLIWRGGTLKDFELRATIRQKGNNSGIQYRSAEMKNVGRWSIGGYQCDIHPAAAFNGMLYHERGRGIVAQNGQRVIVDEKGQKFLVQQREPKPVDLWQWHEYTIIARGNKIVHKLDGLVVMELTDHDLAKRSLEGLLAIQIHGGPAMRVEIKDVQLKPLPPSPVVTLAQEPIPADAKLIVPAKPKAKPKKK
jgi:hypothetical protein